MPKKKELDIQGDISIDSENILPVIKKYLYSENEIFVRELISNGFDAITKLKKISNVEAIDVVPEKWLVDITIDEKKKTITFSDNGVGLDAEEVQKYINKVAFSGATDFIEKYKGDEKENQIIGHFGLGFYSSFIISSEVEIRSLSYKKDAKSIRWSCDGSTHFSLKDGDRKEIGTDIILHVSEESKDYLSEMKITELVQKYANFLPVEIHVNGKQVNHDEPLWEKQPKDVKEEEYKEFYKTLFPYQQDPLFWIHLNVEYPFRLKGILFFPKILHELDANKGKVKLYCQNVFVTDQAKDVIPEFLTLLQGAIDCPEIPLNVSRSYLQNDPYVRKISGHIVKKVADKLNSLYKTDKEHFESFWADISHFIKYGMMNDDDFYKKVKDIVIFPSSNGDNVAIPDYLERNKEVSENKVFYCSNKDEQAAYVEMCKSQNIEVVYLQSVVDSHFISFLESKDSKIKYVAIDSEISDHLVDDSKKSEVLDADNKTKNESISGIFKDSLSNDKLKIETKYFKTDDVPALLLESEQSKRLKQMSVLMNQPSMPGLDDFTLILNENNELIDQVLKLSNNSERKEDVKLLCEHVYDLALMSQKPLTGEKMKSFLNRSNTLLKTLALKL
ncbi:molecular chaperone HtpG [Candidatus Marinamargulisbacteria bacterium SCGC AG-343-D04]|nr:molecular chaperone HtpG [Candidatus Marinamargulisbacteria bacterium SCGC AG-343-D04]